jgi:hypothetical protein
MIYDDSTNGMVDNDRGVIFYDQYPSLSHHDDDHERNTVIVRKEGARYLCEESRGGLVRIGTRWLFRYRCGDVPLAAMRAAVFTRHGVNDVPTERATVSSLCTSCNMNAIEDYQHVILECPAYYYQRQSLVSCINHIRSSYAASGRSCDMVIPVPSDVSNNDHTVSAASQLVVIDDDTEQLWVAASQPTPPQQQQQQRHTSLPSSAPLPRSQFSRVEERNDPPLPWQWWLRSPVVRELLSNVRYENAIKLFLARVMARRAHIARQPSCRHVARVSSDNHVNHDNSVSHATPLAAVAAAASTTVVPSAQPSAHDPYQWHRVHHDNHHHTHVISFATPIIGRIRRVSIVESVASSV